MEEQRLESMIRGADRAAGGPAPVPDDMAARVRHLARRRRRSRVGGTAVAAVALLIGSGVWFGRSPTATDRRQLYISAHPTVACTAERLGRQPPAPWILDLSNPKIDGWTVARTIRGDVDPAIAGKPILALAPQAMKGDRVRAIGGRVRRLPVEARIAA